ncbi:CsgG/HfaB family protein, partial [Vibrio breoganii]
LEVEMGYSQNEPVNIAVMSAIDAAVIHLIVKGMKRGMWSPGDPNALQNPIIARYSEESADIL